MTSTTKIQAYNLQKFVEARGEYQTTRYSASKRLNTRYGDEIRVPLSPQPNLHNYNLHKIQSSLTVHIYIARNSTTTLRQITISSITTLQQSTYPQQQQFNKLHILNNKLSIHQSQISQKVNHKISKRQYQVHQ